jgi:hypothetical protein
MPCCRQAPRNVTEPDPIFAAIERHRYWNRRTDELWGDGSSEVSREAEAARDAAVNSRWRLCETVPTTMAGLAALLNFAMEEQGRLELPLPDDHEETMLFIASVTQCVHGLAVQS